ncbi:unnamed protein product [Closterium sp. NIES-54]
MPGMRARASSPSRQWSRRELEERPSLQGTQELVVSREAMGIRDEDRGPPHNCRWNSASLPKVEVADRYIGIPGVGPTLKNYVMQLETAQYCWEHDGFDPRFFWKMVVTLAGEVVTIYWMVRKEILDELEQGIIENPTERFVQLLKREFIGQTIVRLEEFWEFRRRKEESFLAYYNHLQELAEDLEKQDERLLVQKFVRSLDDELRPMVRTADDGFKGASEPHVVSRGLPLYTGTLWGHRYRTVGDAKSRMLREKVAARGERPGRKEDAAASCLEGAGGVTTADADHVNSARRRSYGA